MEIVNSVPQTPHLVSRTALIIRCILVGLISLFLLCLGCYLCGYPGTGTLVAIAALLLVAIGGAGLFWFARIAMKVQLVSQICHYLETGSKPPECPIVHCRWPVIFERSGDLFSARCPVCNYRL
jgi:hypothetical protein